MKFLKKNKKSQFQFNWIFVIVAGAIILAFFVNFTVKYIDLQNKKDSALIAASLDNILLELQQSSFSLENEFNLQPTTYEFSCDKIEVGNFLTRSLSERFVFAPSKLETDTLDLYMEKWNYPFRIANFFYISDKRPYTLVYDSDSENFAKSLDLPKKFNIQLSSSAGKGKIISFGKNPSSGNVQIVPKDNNYEEGYVYINNKQYPLFGIPFVYGAIFSDNYPCMLDRILQKYKEIIRIYEDKAKILSQLKPNCNYDQLYTRLKQMENNIDKKEYDKIKENSAIIKEQNNNLGQECPTLF